MTAVPHYIRLGRLGEGEERSLKTAIEELVKQREFLLANQWVPYSPVFPGEGCLVNRRPAGWGQYGGIIRIGRHAMILLSQALGVVTAATWNDSVCKSSGEAIAALDRGIALGKQRLADLADTKAG